MHAAPARCLGHRIPRACTSALSERTELWLRRRHAHPTNHHQPPTRNQPTNQPTNRPTNQPHNQPTNQSTNQPTHKPTSPLRRAWARASVAQAEPPQHCLYPGDHEQRGGAERTARSRRAEGRVGHRGVCGLGVCLASRTAGLLVVRTPRRAAALLSCVHAGCVSARACVACLPLSRLILQQFARLRCAAALRACNVLLATILTGSMRSIIITLSGRPPSRKARAS